MKPLILLLLGVQKVLDNIKMSSQLKKFMNYGGFMNNKSVIMLFLLSIGSVVFLRSMEDDCPLPIFSQWALDSHGEAAVGVSGLSLTPPSVLPQGSPQHSSSQRCLRRNRVTLAADEVTSEPVAERRVVRVLTTTQKETQLLELLSVMLPAKFEEIRKIAWRSIIALPPDTPLSMVNGVRFAHVAGAIAIVEMALSRTEKLLGRIDVAGPLQKPDAFNRVIRDVMLMVVDDLCCLYVSSNDFARLKMANFDQKMELLTSEIFPFVRTLGLNHLCARFLLRASQLVTFVLERISLDVENRESSNVMLNKIKHLRIQYLMESKDL